MKKEDINELKNDEIFAKINKTIDSINEQIKDSEESKVLKCPICNDNLMYMEPDGTILHCRNCDKYFKNNNGSVGNETTSPYIDSKALY